LDSTWDQGYLFGIDTTPTNVGVGSMFIKDIFSYFDIDRLYLPSHPDHPVWNKIATKTEKEGFNGLTIFFIDVGQLS